MIPRLASLFIFAFFTSAFFFPSTSAASPIGKILTVQVFVLCNDAGLNCASRGPAGDDYFAIEVNKIWAQAGIGVGFSFVQNINSTAFSFLDDSVLGDGFDNLSASYGAMGPNATTVDLFLVPSVVGAYGEGYLGQGGIVMGMDDVMAFNNGLGRIDTAAHELGHNFGLVPGALGGDAGAHSANANYLMAGGGGRNVPLTSADINPGGLGWDILPADQIALARQSSLLSDAASTPEPGSRALTLSGAFAVVIIRRKQ